LSDPLPHVAHEIDHLKPRFDIQPSDVRLRKRVKLIGRNDAIERHGAVRLNLEAAIPS